jgi:hypothetical protein
MAEEDEIAEHILIVGLRPCCRGNLKGICGYSSL